MSVKDKYGKKRINYFLNFIVFCLLQKICLPILTTIYSADKLLSDSFHL